jgi:hypothetical protein
MDLAQFKRSLDGAAPPPLAPPLRTLWFAAKGDWDKAHALVMDATGAEAAWVHAYLHRVEGDLDNARYWYRQAKRPSASGTLEAEWDAIVAALLSPDG